MYDNGKFEKIVVNAMLRRIEFTDEYSTFTAEDTASIVTFFVTVPYGRGYCLIATLVVKIIIDVDYMSTQLEVCYLCVKTTMQDSGISVKVWLSALSFLKASLGVPDVVFLQTSADIMPYYTNLGFRDSNLVPSVVRFFGCTSLQVNFIDLLETIENKARPFSVFFLDSFYYFRDIIYLLDSPESTTTDSPQSTMVLDTNSTTQGVGYTGDEANSLHADVPLTFAGIDFSGSDGLNADGIDFDDLHGLHYDVALGCYFVDSYLS